MRENKRHKPDEEARPRYDAKLRSVFLTTMNHVVELYIARFTTLAGYRYT